MKHGNVFGYDAYEYGAERMPVWISVDEQKIAGGVIDISHNKRGDLIPLGIPVYLSKMGEVVVLDSYKVVGAVTTDATSIKLAKGVYGTMPAEGMILGKVSNGTGKGGALGATEDGETFAITAGAFGALNDGDMLLVVSAVGASKAAVLPNGLSRREIFVDTNNPQHATVAVVTKGQILADRIPAISEEYKKALVGITFEYEL